LTPHERRPREPEWEPDQAAAELPSCEGFQNHAEQANGGNPDTGFNLSYGNLILAPTTIILETTTKDSFATADS
jgi:hypothetical protein